MIVLKPESILGSIDVGEKNLGICIGTSSNIIFWKYFDVIGERKTKSIDIFKSCEKISSLLKEIDWSMCNTILIEKQLRSNFRAQRLEQHIWSWFSIIFPLKKIIFVHPKHKTHFFGEQKLSYYQRKKFSVKKVKEILEERGDSINLEYIKNVPKADDICDAYLQLLVFVKGKKKL